MRVGFPSGGDEVGGRALEDDPAAVVAGAGTEVDDPVGVRHDRLVVLDHDDRLAGVHEPVEQAEQLLDVGEVQAGGRLVEDDDRIRAHPIGRAHPAGPFSARCVASLSRWRSPPDSVGSGWPRLR